MNRTKLYGYMAVYMEKEAFDVDTDPVEIDNRTGKPTKPIQA